jgi:hypothetical protein
MNLVLALLAISALAVALATHKRTRHLVQSFDQLTQPHVPARHAIVRRPTGPRQHTGTMAQRDRIPLQVPEAVETARALIIEAYAAGDDDLLIKPFVSTDNPDNTPVVVAVP